MAEFEHDGWRLSYSDTGGDGPAVLLLHGLLFDRSMFDPQVAALRDRYRIVTPDSRGHGESERRPEEFTQWDVMEDHLALLDHLGIERAVWGGVSQGGFQSLRAALKHPDRVTALVLIETQAGAEDQTKAQMYEAFADVIVTEGWNDDLLQTVVPIFFSASTSEDVSGPWKERWRSEDVSAARETLHAVTRREDITDRLGEIEQPALVIHGEDDGAIEMERAEQLAAGLPGLVELVKVPRAGHSSTIEQPEAVTAAIERFLEKVSPA